MNRPTTEEKKLSATIKSLTNKLIDLKDQRITKRNQKYHGRYYRYRPGSGSISRRPWVYIKVSCDKEGWLTGFTFRASRQGVFSLEMAKFVGYQEGLHNGYVEVTRAEFDEAWAGFATQITSLHRKERRK